MDATPVTLGQELGAYAHQVATAADRIEGCLARVGGLPLGGTAVGNGINAPASFGRRVVARLGERTGLPLSVAPDRFAAQGSIDDLVELSGHLRSAAVALVKVADDIRWLASGPNTGLAEIRLPDLQPGSSIMPGKVNPVLCEVVAQVGAQVMGNDAVVAFAGLAGSFRAQHLPTGGGPQPARVDRSARHLHPAVRRPLRRRDRGRRGALPAVRRELAGRGHRAEPTARLRGGRPPGEGEPRHRSPAP